MSDDVVTVLLWSEVIGGGDYFLDNWRVYVGPRELLKHALDYSAAALVLAQQKDLVLD